MALDTYSDNLGLILMGTGNNNNSWGTVWNASAGAIIDRAIAGKATQNSTGGSLDLSASPPPAGPRLDLDAIQDVTGTLSSNLTITVPNLPKIWIFRNSTSGAYHVYVKTSSGTAVQIPQGTSKMLFCDGNNVITRMDKREVGKIKMSAAGATGAGELACSGASLLRADYPDLFAEIGTTWGAVDGTHFTLPNFTDTNRFPRAAGGSVTAGTYQSNQNKAHTHTGSGTTGNQSADHSHNFSGNTGAMNQNASHTHSVNQNAYWTTNSGAGVGGGGAFGVAGTTSISLNATNTDHIHAYSGTTAIQNTSHNHTFSFTSASDGGTEGRPESAAVIFSITF